MVMDNMFALVGQKLGEQENIYETIESYTSEIERELLQRIDDMDIDDRRTSKSCRPSSKRIHKASKPIVIYEEPIEQLHLNEDDPYVVAYREDADDTYETIGSLSTEKDGVSPSLPPNRHTDMHCEVNYDVRRPASKCESLMLRGSSTSTLNIHNVHDHWLKMRPDNQQVLSDELPSRQPVSCKGCYQVRMEDVAKKVSLLQGRGQLKLSVYVNCGLLTIHIVQARHLSSKSMINCNTYVKLSLVPDDTRRTKCKTRMAYESNSPFFDEKFSFELLDGDLKKRLLISVWNRDYDKGKSEFLGCMSFGIHHIQGSRRVVNGWYYLLTEDVGRRKHLRVVERRALNDDPSSLNRGWMDPHIVVVRRTGSGFGFTVTGSAPVRVCKVEPRSPADSAGLQKDDCIVRINGHNVSKSTSDAVARLVKLSPKQLILEIQRARPLDTMLSSPWKPALCSTFLPASSCSDQEGDEFDGQEGEDVEESSVNSLRSSSPPPLRLEDLVEEKNLRPSRYLMGSGGSTGSARSSGSGRYYRESLV